MSEVHTVSRAPSHVRKYIFLLYLVVIVRGIFFAITLPLGQGPDEPAHVAHILLYVRQSQMQIVGLNEPGIDSRQLWAHMFWPKALQQDPELLTNIFATLQAARFWELVEAPAPYPTLAEDMARQDLIKYVAPRRYMTPIYFFLVSLPLRWMGIQDIFEQWLLMRMLSVICGLGVIGFTYAAARLLWPDERRWEPPAAAAIIAFLPQFSFLSSVVSPDNLVALIASAVLYMACRIGVGKGAATDLSLLLGLAMLCAAVKEQGIPVLLFAVCALPFLMRWQYQNRRGLDQRAVLVLAGVVFVSVIGVSIVANSAALGRAIEVVQGRVSEFAALLSVSPKVYIRFFLIAFVSFWFAYGWAVFKMSLGWYLIFAAITLIATVGVARALFSGQSGRTVTRYLSLLLLFVAICLFSVLVVLGPQDDGVQGRHFLAAFPAISILLAMGVSEISGEHHREVILRYFIISMVFLSAIAVTKYLIPLFYLGAFNS